MNGRRLFARRQVRQNRCIRRRRANCLNKTSACFMAVKLCIMITCSQDYGGTCGWAPNLMLDLHGSLGVPTGVNQPQL